MKKNFYFLFLLVCSLPVAAQIGRVGINTTTPSAMLQVKDSSVLFSSPEIVALNSIFPPVSGAGARMMWFPPRGAFRVGTVTGTGATKWDRDSIGYFSVAIGFNTKANGDYSTALGTQTTSSGQQSTAIGYETIASGHTSTAMGVFSIASGTESTAMGRETVATGRSSVAMGFRTKAKAFGSVVLGRYNDTLTSFNELGWVDSDPLFIIGNGDADNDRSNAFMVLKNGKTGINTNYPLAMLHVKDSNVVFTGASNVAGTPGNPPVSGIGVRMMWYPDKAAFRAGGVSSTQWDKDSIGYYSFASGSNAKAKGFASSALGINSLSAGQTSMAFGLNLQATGDYSVAMGSSTKATGYNSTAMGFSSEASGDYSFAIGTETHSIGDFSTTFGSQTHAYGQLSTAIGFSASAYGGVSTAFQFSNSVGYGSTSFGGGLATGDLSIATGFATARPYASMALGQFNDSSGTSSTTTWVNTDPVFMIGNGTADNVRNNALTILKNAKTGINTSSPQAMLHIKESAVPTAQYNTNSVAIFEGSSNGAFIQLSQPTNVQSGIISGNSVTSIRSALIFRADSSVHIRTGGNNTNFVVDKLGNTGIGTSFPSALLDVAGGAEMNSLNVSGATSVSTLKVGSNGSTVAEIIKVSVNDDLPSIAVNTTFLKTFAVANAQLTSTVYISPGNSLSDGLLISYARVSAVGTVEVKFRNVSAAAIDPAAMNFYITVIR